MNKSTSGTSKRQRDSGLASSGFTTKTGSTGPYDPQFEQLLIDNGVYPDGYRTAGGTKPPKPRNMEDICRRLSQPRPSLSPSRFSEGDFEDFQDKNRGASSEQLVMEDVMPMIRGNTGTKFYHAGNTVFNNLIELAPDIANSKADGYDGAIPSEIDPPVRKDLDGYIVPSTRKDLPAAPNNLTEVKGPAGRSDHLRRQAMYAGATGARGTFKLQNYGNETPVYDGNAYTFVQTYHAGEGSLRVYATHPAQSTAGQTEYFTTQLESYAMTGNINNFRQGAAAFRNSRDLSKEQRDSFIASANATARARLPTMATPSNNSVSVSPNSSRTYAASFESDTSTDELAREDEEPPKRQRKRSTATSNASGDVHARGRQTRQQGTRDTSLPTSQPPSASTEGGYIWLGYLFRPLQGGNYAFNCTIRGRAQFMTATWIPGEPCPQIFDERGKEWLQSSLEGQSLRIYVRGRWVKLDKQV